MSESGKPKKRVQRTRKQLQQALEALIDERPYVDITINEITERASLSRATFYLHFTDKDALFQHVVADFAESIVDCGFWDTPLLVSNNDSLTRLFNHVRENQQVLRVLLEPTSNIGFAQQFHVHIEQTIFDWISKWLPQPNLTEDKQKMMSNFIAASLNAMISWWIAQDMQVSAEEMAHSTRTTFMFGVMPTLFGGETP